MGRGYKVRICECGDVVKDFLADEFGLNRVWSLGFLETNSHQDHIWQ